jgi:hypothetical protein
VFFKGRRERDRERRRRRRRRKRKRGALAFPIKQILVIWPL